MPVVLILLSFAWPLAGLYYSVSHFKIAKARLLLFLFYLIAAYLIIPYEHGDIMFYINRMETIKDFNLDRLISELGRSLIGRGEDGFEIFVTLNLFLVSRFTDNVSFSFVLTAAVYYIFWINIIKELYNEYSIHNRKNVLAIVALIFFAVYVIFFRAVNGRFYLAYWGYILGFYKIVVKKEYKYLWLTFGTIFIHQAFVFANVLLLIYISTQKLHKSKSFEIILFALIIAGTVYAEVGVNLVNESLQYMGNTVEDKFLRYTEEGYIETWSTRERTWFQDLRGNILFYTLVICILIFRFRKKIHFNKQAFNIYYFFLIFWAANVFTYNVASMGERFRNVLIGIGILLLFKILNTNRLKKVPIYLWAFAAAFLLYKMVTLRVLAEYINIWIFTPFSIVINLLIGEHSLLEFIK